MTRKFWVLSLLLAGAMSVTASAPVAMRVELEPVRQVGALTEVAILVQVSPEDRTRIGSNAILRIELDGGTVSSGSPMRAVWLEDDGSTRTVVAWPPGEHHLRVEIEDPSKEDTGLWVGTVRIPDLSPGTTIEEVGEAEPAPAPEPIPESEMLELEISQPEPEPEPVPGKTESVTPQPVPDPAPAAPEPVGAEAVAETTPDRPVSEELTIAEPAAADAVVVREGSESVIEERSEAIEQPEAPEVENQPEPAEVGSEMVVDSQPTEEPPEVIEEPSLVEPLRADPPPHTAEPKAAPGCQQVETAPGLVPASADLAARYEEWGNPDPEIREFSMIVTHGREPATDIGIDGFQLRVGGSKVNVEQLGDTNNAPLLLGLAIDVAADEVDSWSGMRGSLSPIVGRAEGGRGRIFVSTHGGVGAWDADKVDPGGVTVAKKTENVAQLVMASIERFEDVYGRTFLVILTDGRNEPPKDEWQQATAVAGAAGVPILVIALWDDDFNNRTRKNLKKLTDISGGSLFLVQGRAQLESAADRFGRYLDGGYSIRFRPPDGDRQGLTPISVSSSDKKVDVSAPKSIR